MDDNSTGTAPYQQDTMIWSSSANYHPTRPLTLSGCYAGKYTEYDADGLVSDNTRTLSMVAVYTISANAGMSVYKQVLTGMNKQMT
ncbi:hypothetical protein [Psychrobacter sp.]|uniref:hypothetical protein n=1 Tax=Psychrobacter sp. TaxID=56811 RepID=UPI0026482E8F|nr:hypothetical protein [Psychrobacter sp.]MDN6276051.1 hypothetical protein [Psychrobacter sp.]MDN6308502.1 hypothetical protein [Psychrobacter sp.]